MTDTNPRPVTPLLNISEVAAMLQVDVRHVRRLVFERRIPFVKWGHLLRFDRAVIEAWIKESSYCVGQANKRPAS